MEVDMDAAVWGGLPSEIAERALSFLSAPVLCRFRTVCKRWNSFICNPEFGALCIRNATQDAAASFVALTYVDLEKIKLSGPTGTEVFIRCLSEGWLFLDVKAKRWHTIKAKLTDDKFFDGPHPPSDYGRCLAMDGGLVCQLLPGHKKVVVCNLIAQTESTMLPTLKYRISWNHAEVNMVVDVSTGWYTIFVLPTWLEPRSERNTSMVIYESRTNAWRSSSLLVINRALRCVEDIMCFNGLLYVLAWSIMEDALQSRSLLWSYNNVEDNWKDTGVICSKPLYCPRLLGIDNRLFLASWVREDNPMDNWLYQVREIDLQERTLRSVLRVTMLSNCQSCSYFGKTMNLVMPSASESWKKRRADSFQRFRT